MAAHNGKGAAIPGCSGSLEKILVIDAERPGQQVNGAAEFLGYFIS